MLKQISTLIFIISFLYSCNSSTGNSKAAKDKVSVNQVNSNAIQEKVVEEPYINDYRDPYMEVSHNRNPIILSTDESQKLFDFFERNKGNQITFEIAQLFNENELSEEEFNGEMKLYVSDFYHSGKNALLFIKITSYVGSGLSVLSIHNNMIVSKIHRFTLDADSDGNYSLSGKYNISGLGQIKIDITEKEYFLNETGINNFVIEYLESRVYNYELSADSNGIIAMNNNKVYKSLEFSTNLEELESWNKEDLRKLRNYIFAKHLYIFKSHDLSEYFKQFDWYEAKYENVDNKLSDADKEFIRIVKALEDI